MFQKIPPSRSQVGWIEQSYRFHLKWSRIKNRNEKFPGGSYSVWHERRLRNEERPKMKVHWGKEDMKGIGVKETSVEDGGFTVASPEEKKRSTHSSSLEGPMLKLELCFGAKDLVRFNHTGVEWVLLVFGLSGPWTFASHLRQPYVRYDLLLVVVEKLVYEHFHSMDSPRCRRLWRFWRSTCVPPTGFLPTVPPLMSVVSTHWASDAH